MGYVRPGEDFSWTQDESEGSNNTEDEEYMMGLPSDSYIDSDKMIV